MLIVSWYVELSWRLERYRVVLLCSNFELNLCVCFDSDLEIIVDCRWGRALYIRRFDLCHRACDEPRNKRQYTSYIDKSLCLQTKLNTLNTKETLFSNSKGLHIIVNVVFHGNVVLTLLLLEDKLWSILSSWMQSFRMCSNSYNYYALANTCTSKMFNSCQLAQTPTCFVHRETRFSMLDKTFNNTTAST